MTKKWRQKLWRLGLGLVGVVVLILVGREDLLKEIVKKEVGAGELEIATVARIVDGDTIELSDGRKVRYIGVDTPETKDPRKPVECFGAEASEFNRQLVEGKIIGLEKDVSETDRYGRLLRYVYLLENQAENGASTELKTDAEPKMVQEILLAEGYAQVYRYPPDVKQIDNFKIIEAAARENQKGLWSAESCL